MIALLSALGLSGVGLALIFMPGLRAVVFAVLGKLPWQVWAGAAALALLVGGCVWHGSAVNAARTAALAEGKEAEKRRWEQAFQTMKLASETWKSNYEAVSQDLANERSARHAEDLRRIAAGADDLRLRGPGRAAAPRCGSIADSGLGTATGGPERPQGGGDDPVAPLPDPEGLAIVPWGRLVEYAEDHDRWRAEALTWRSWYLEQKELLRLRKTKLPQPAFGN
jgi:hypothetical protein